MKKNRRMVEGIVLAIIGIATLIYGIVTFTTGISYYNKIYFDGRKDVTGKVISRVATMYEDGTRYNCLVEYTYNGETYSYVFPYKKADSNDLPETGKQIKYSIKESRPDVLMEYKEVSLLFSIISLVTALLTFIICGILSLRDLIGPKLGRRKH